MRNGRAAALARHTNAFQLELAAIRLERPRGRRVEKDIEDAHAGRAVRRGLPAANQQESDGVRVFDQSLQRPFILTAESHRPDQRLPRSQIQREMGHSFSGGPRCENLMAQMANGDAAVVAIRGEIDGRLRGCQRIDEAEFSEPGEQERTPEFGP